MSEKEIVEKMDSEDLRLENGDSTFAEAVYRVQSLGSVRLRSATTGDIVLVPTPTKDPNDPLVSSLETAPYFIELVTAHEVWYHDIDLFRSILGQFSRRWTCDCNCADCANIFSS
jgi:hypothetical protein